MHSLILYIVCVLFLYRYTTAQWSEYPTCVQQLQPSDPTVCNFGSSTPQEVDESDSCICVNQDILTYVAQSIYTTCGCDDLITSASIMVAACEDSGTTPVYDAAQIISAGDGGKSLCQNINALSSSAAVAERTVTGTTGMLLLTRVYFSQSLPSSL